MTTVDRPQGVRPPLPRLVEQLRVLLWLQAFLSVLGVLVSLIGAQYVDRRKMLSSGDAYFRLRGLQDRLEVVVLGLLAVAVLLSVCAPLVRRRWPPVHVFVLAVEALVVAVIVATVGTGLAGTVLMVFYAALAAWIVVDLFRADVVRHLWRVGGQPGRAVQG